MTLEQDFINDMKEFMEAQEHLPFDEEKEALNHKLYEMANLEKKLKTEIEEKEAELSTLKRQYRQLTETDMPDLMTTTGISELKMADGRSITLSTKYYARLVPDHKQGAIHWLIDNGHDAIVKSVVQVPFKAKEFDKAKALSLQLRKDGWDVTADRSVHTRTLQAWYRNMVEEEREESIPARLIDAHIIKIAKVE